MARPVFICRIRQFFQDIAQLIKDTIDAYKGVRPESTEGNMILRMKDIYQKLQPVFAEGLYESGENFRTAEKNTATEGGVRYALESKTQPGKLDPRTVTKGDVVYLLHQVEDGTIYGNTYIPVRIGTPQTLIYWAAKRNADIIENNPIAISADKAYNAMNRDGETDENDGRPNRLTADEIVALVENMNNPEYIVYQGENERYVEVIKFNRENGDSAFAIIEIGNNKDAVYMNGYEGGLYNILVTTYPPRTGKLKALLNGSKNKVIYDKKKDAPQRTSSSTVLSVLNDASFYENIVSETVASVKENDSTKSGSIKNALRRKVQPTVESMLRKENAALQKDVARLKELLVLQRTETKGTVFKQSSVNTAANLLKKNNNASGNSQELAALLDDFYKYIAKGEELTWEGVREKAMPAVNWLQEHVKQERSEYAQDVLNSLRGSRVYLDDVQKSEAAYRYGSFGITFGEN